MHLYAYAYVECVYIHEFSSGGVHHGHAYSHMCTHNIMYMYVVRVHNVMYTYICMYTGP